MLWLGMKSRVLFRHCVRSSDASADATKEIQAAAVLAEQQSRGGVLQDPRNKCLREAPRR